MNGHFIRLLHNHTAVKNREKSLKKFPNYDSVEGLRDESRPNLYKFARAGSLILTHSVQVASPTQWPLQL